MPRAVLLALGLVVALVATASAEPLSFQIKTDVPTGSRPTITLSANEAVSNIRIELKRDDGKQFTVTHKGLGARQRATLAIGDGAPGKAHYQAKLSLTITGKGTWTSELEFDTVVRAPIGLRYDFDHLDLKGRVLQFQATRPVARADLVVIGESGEEIGRGTATYTNEPAGKWLPISWKQDRPENVIKMKLHVVGTDGIEATHDLVPWSVEIAHEEVLFDTDKADIKPEEAKKLDASLKKIEEIVQRVSRHMQVKLYVAGHTDTQGGKPKNRKLSLARARAIAAYFRKKGLALPIAYEGFGEEVLKVPTADEVDEVRNRRSDYVLGPVGGTPPFRGPYLKVKATWKAIK